MNKEQTIDLVQSKGKRIIPFVAEIQDYPEQGVSFKDITPILQDPLLFAEVNDCLAQLVGCFGDVDLIVSPESRGFLFGPVLADRLKIGFIPARKPGKLPREIIEASYGMEYGENKVQIHKDAIRPGEEVVIVDDVLATGGTAKAIAELVEHSGGIVVGYVFFIVLDYLNGVQALGEEKVLSVIKYS